jgi:hypothetical protein
MSEALGTWLVLFLVGLTIVVFFVLPAVLVFRLVRTRREEFYCPWVHRNVAVQFATIDGQRPIGVFSCTAFPGTTGVLCGMPCLTTAGTGSLSKEPKEHVLDLLNE